MILPKATPAPAARPHAGASSAARACADGRPARVVVVFTAGLEPRSVSCAKTSPQLLNKLEKAITAATQAHPEYFDLNDKKCDNCYKVKNETGYFNEVVRQLSVLGVCAKPDADEIGIKSTNDLSEWYDIYLGSGHIRRGQGAYLYGCNPANF